MATNNNYDPFNNCLTNSINGTDRTLYTDYKVRNFSAQDKIIINGHDILDRISTLEKLAGLPERDPELEKKYPQLKAAYDDYVKLLAKYRTFEKISKDYE